MDDRKIVVRFPSEKKRFSLLQNAQTGSEASKRALGTLSWGQERLKREADHSLPPTAEVQKAWSCASTPPLLAWCAME
jgi:hypothetical protein